MARKPGPLALSINCPSCAAKAGEGCNIGMNGMNHPNRSALASFLRYFGAFMQFGCKECGARKGEPCVPYRPNGFGKVSNDKAAAKPHRSRLEALEKLHSNRR
jgi:hypothetical protein